MTRREWLELAVVAVVAALAAAWVPWSTGYMAWSWDALNHHIYLGFTAEHTRWHLDVLPASFQTYQYPYLYWPVYRLSLLDAPGAVVGAGWSAFQAVMLVLPLWVIARALLPVGDRPALALQRAAACGLGCMSAVVLISLETTSNDMLAAVPLLWAVASGLLDPGRDRNAFATAALWGAAVAFKLSNGLFLPFLLMWWWQPQRPHLRLRRALALASGALVGFTVMYGPWGLALWRVTGNPFHPFFGQFFGGA